MFNKATIRYDEKKDIYVINGIFGSRFKRYLEKNIINSSRAKQLFVDYGAFEISFYGFFAIEVKVVLQAFLDLSFSRINVKVINETINLIEEQTWLKDMNGKFNDTFDYSVIKEKMRFKPLEHQEEIFTDYNAMKHRMHYRGRLIAAEPGAGKTFSALALSELVKSNRVLIIAPLPSLNTVWVDSITNTVYNKPQDYYVIDKTKEYNDEKFIIVNYEAMEKIGDIVKRIAGKDTTIIIDESHNMNELKSKRTNLLLTICNTINSDNVILLTGTPIKARPIEMAPMIELLDRRFNNVIKNRFLKLYKSMPTVLHTSITERYTTYRISIKKDRLKLKPVVTKELPIILKNGKDYTLETIQKKAKKYIQDRTKEIKDKFNTYEKTYNDLYEKAKEMQIANGLSKVVFVKYEKDIKKIKDMYYRRKLIYIPEIIKDSNNFEATIIRPMLDPLEKKMFTEAKTIVKYLSLKIQGEVLGIVIGRERIRCHADMAKHIDYDSIINSTTKKTLIFTNYVDVANEAFKKLEKDSYAVLKVYGDETKHLTHTVNKFMTEDKYNPLIATYKSLSTAVPLISANVMICIDLPFRSYVLNQTVSRIHRLGQDKTVYIYQCQLDTGNTPNINSRNIDIIAWSSDMVSKITGEDVNIEVIKNEGTENGNIALNDADVISGIAMSIEERKNKILDADNIHMTW